MKPFRKTIFYRGAIVVVDLADGTAKMRSEPTWHEPVLEAHGDPDGVCGVAEQLYGQAVGYDMTYRTSPYGDALTVSGGGGGADVKLVGFECEIPMSNPDELRAHGDKLRDEIHGVADFWAGLRKEAGYGR